eukprot:1161546-Pelagomonas_calceolata.AAC.4
MEEGSRQANRLQALKLDHHAMRVLFAVSAGVHESMKQARQVHEALPLSRLTHTHTLPHASRYALSPLAPSLPTASKDSNPAVAPSSTGMQASSSGRADPPSPVRSDSSSGNAWESLKGSYSPTSQTPAGSCMESMHSVDGSVSFPDLQSQTSSSSSSGSGGGGSSNSMQSSPGTHKVDAKVWREGTVAAAAAAAGKEGIGSSVDHSSSKAVGWKESISSSSGVSNSSPSSSNGSSPSSSGAPGVPSALSAILSGGISGVVVSQGWHLRVGRKCGVM